MKRYRRKEIVEAVQWFKMGDHPDVEDIPEKYKDYVPVKLGATGFIYSKNRDSGYFVTPSDWIVKFNEEDDVHRYQDNIFKELFEEIEEDFCDKSCKECEHESEDCVMLDNGIEEHYKGELPLIPER